MQRRERRRPGSRLRKERRRRARITPRAPQRPPLSLSLSLSLSSSSPVYHFFSRCRPPGKPCLRPGWISRPSCPCTAAWSAPESPTPRRKSFGGVRPALLDAAVSNRQDAARDPGPAASAAGQVLRCGAVGGGRGNVRSAQRQASPGLISPVVQCRARPIPVAPERAARAAASDAIHDSKCRLRV